MDDAEYRALDRLEDHLWWFAGLHGNIVTALRPYVSGNSKPRVLDAGCGTGGILDRISTLSELGLRVGLDYDHFAARRAAEKSNAVTVAGTINTLPFQDQYFDAIVCADVLCHRSVSPEVTLREFARILRARGVVIINLPAYQWLMSYHDVSGHTVRRFTARAVRELLGQSGFEVLRQTYWNTFLFPLMVVKRKVLGGTPGQSDVRRLPAAINGLFRAVVGLESRLIGSGVTLPFGGSVLTVARKINGQDR